MQDHFEIRNEFAWVRLEHAEDGNAARLRITDVRSGRSVMMDALELDMLAFCRHADFAWCPKPGAVVAPGPGWGDALERPRVAV